jgi:signal transduction histidine kinase
LTGLCCSFIISIVQCSRCLATVADEDETCASCGTSLRLAILEVVRGNAPERLHFLKPRSYLIGRARCCDLRITEPSVSKTHARLTHEGGRFYVEDQGSLHGVFVNASKTERAELTPGCQLQLGNVTLRFSALDNEGSTGEVALFPWVEQQQLLLSLVQSLNSTLVLSEVLDQILDAVLSITHAERGFLLLATEQTSAQAAESVAGLRVRASRRRDGGSLEPSLAGLSLPLIRRAVERGQTVSASEPPGDGDGSQATVTLTERSSAVCIPLSSTRGKDWVGDGRRDILGAIYVDNYSLPFGVEILRAAEALARHAALAVENALVFAREQQTIEELRRTQQQLLHSEKLATIGMMAAGIAHELNTPLTYILGNIELLTLRELPEEQRGLLDSIEKGALRLKALAQNLLAFSRPSKEEPVATSANDLIERSLEMCRYPILKGGVRVERQLGDGLPPLCVVPSDIETALINLIINAVQVIPRGGTLTLRSRALDSGMVEITVADTGPGIPEALRARIFEPFVTSKPEGQGTGLGLSTTSLIVERHSGKIDFATEIGRGTEFRVLLPASATPPLERAAEPVASVGSEQP